VYWAEWFAIPLFFVASQTVTNMYIRFLLREKDVLTVAEKAEVALFRDPT
jgi:hypothetical protein